MECTIDDAVNLRDLVVQELVEITEYVIQGDSIARGPKLLSIKYYVIEIMT